jgi:hypothetical protein
MTATELAAALVVRGNQHRIFAEAKLREADLVMEEAALYAARFLGPSMEGMRQRIMAEARTKAETLRASAERAKLGATLADQGRLLWGPVEWQDPAIALSPEVNRLVSAAGRYGVMVSE